MTGAQLRLVLGWIIADMSLHLMSVEQFAPRNWRIVFNEGIDDSVQTFDSWNDFYVYLRATPRWLDGCFDPFDSPLVESERGMLQQILEDFARGVPEDLVQEHLASLRGDWEAAVQDWIPQIDGPAQGFVIYLPILPLDPIVVQRGEDGLWRSGPKSAKVV